MITEMDRLYFTKTELEYVDTDFLNNKEEEKLIDDAIEIISKAQKTEDYKFTEEETSLIGDAINLQQETLKREKEAESC